MNRKPLSPLRAFKLKSPTEQETLIQTLTSQDAQTTNLYTNIFLGLPLICILPYLPSAYRFTSFLSITSLLLTAYYLYFVPLVPGAPRSQIAFLRSYNSGGDGSASRAWQAWRSYFDEDGPVNRWAGVLNGLLAGLVGLRGYVEGRKGGWTGTEGLWGVLPLGKFDFINPLINEKNYESLDLYFQHKRKTVSRYSGEP
jgi:hypothetical protein